WPGTKVAYHLASCVASRPLHLAPSGATISRGSGRAAQPLASVGAARVSARSVRPTETVVRTTKLGLLSLALVALVVACFPVRRDLLATQQPVDVEEIRVMAGNGILWQIRARESTARVKSAYYPEVPAGFIQSVPSAGSPRPFKI